MKDGLCRCKPGHFRWNYLSSPLLLLNLHSWSFCHFPGSEGNWKRTLVSHNHSLRLKISTVVTKVAVQKHIRTPCKQITLLLYQIKLNCKVSMGSRTQCHCRQLTSRSDRETSTQYNNENSLASILFTFILQSTLKSKKHRPVRNVSSLSGRNTQTPTFPTVTKERSDSEKEVGYCIDEVSHQLYTTNSWIHYQSQWSRILRKVSSSTHPRAHPTTLSNPLLTESFFFPDLQNHPNYMGMFLYIPELQTNLFRYLVST